MKNTILEFSFNGFWGCILEVPLLVNGRNRHKWCRLNSHYLGLWETVKKKEPGNLMDMGGINEFGWS